jgi:hypothetical protein
MNTVISPPWGRDQTENLVINLFFKIFKTNYIDRRLISRIGKHILQIFLFSSYEYWVSKFGFLSKFRDGGRCPISLPPLGAPTPNCIGKPVEHTNKKVHNIVMKLRKGSKKELEKMA